MPLDRLISCGSNRSNFGHSCRHLVFVWSSHLWCTPGVYPWVLFTIYLQRLGHILCSHSIDFHCYANDSQLYGPLNAGSTEVSQILSCLMSKNFLQLNDSEPEVIIITPPVHSTNRVNILSSLGALSKNVWERACNLGLLFHSKLSFDAQVTKAVQWCFSQLKQLSKIQFLSHPLYENIITAFISSRLDCCSALYSTKRNAQRLQLNQNTTAGLLTRTKRSVHITPVLAALSCLPLHFRIDFLGFYSLFLKALNGRAPAYIRDLPTASMFDRCLRSSDSALLMVPKCHLVTKGDQTCALRAPKFWSAHSGVPEPFKRELSDLF